MSRTAWGHDGWNEMQALEWELGSRVMNDLLAENTVPVGERAIKNRISKAIGVQHIEVTASPVKQTTLALAPQGLEHDASFFQQKIVLLDGEPDTLYSCEGVDKDGFLILEQLNGDEEGTWWTVNHEIVDDWMDWPTTTEGKDELVVEWNSAIGAERQVG